MNSEYTTPSDNDNKSTNMTPSGEIIRLNGHERLQHLLTFLTFFILVASGYALRMPEEWILKLGDAGKTLFYYRGLLHRIAGVSMILAGLYHIVYLAAHREGRSFFMAMIPNLKDAKDIFQNLAYYIGKRPSPPDFDRFDYREKAEYLALVAGTIIISVTGVILWTEAYWSKFALDLSLLIHGMEAILATLAIIVWHFYSVHYKPGKFPMSWVWITGKMPLHELEEEHPLQYKRLIEQGLIDSNDTHHATPTKKGFMQVIIEGIVFLSFIFFLGISALLIKLLYFPPEYQRQDQMANKGSMETFFKRSEAKERIGYFHTPDASVAVTVSNPPVCVQCHGTFPHSKSPDVRSFLNMHNYFMACETCHVHQSDIETKMDYVWFDNQTDNRVDALTGDSGVYGAKLVPILTSSTGKLQRLDHSSNEDFVREYQANKNKLTLEEKAKAKVVLHKDISKKPVQCTECHGQKPYIDFATVGYTPERAQSLYRTEVADMINRYMKFYLPTMFDADLMRKQKTEDLEKENRSTK
ncbi:MAG: cytochrome b/b6 domain-containing protein [Desulfocapsaceae bacterium]|nr:cytochrome b/b6 domain-containing protein [Desulfocapsaceae bacterium]